MDVISRKSRIFRVTFFRRILYRDSGDVNCGSEIQGSGFTVQRFRGSEGRNWNSEVGKSERKVSGVRCQKTEIGMGKREGEGRKKAKVGRWGTEVGKIRGERSKVKGERGLKSEFGRRKW